MKWLLYRTYPNLVLEDSNRAKKQVGNVNNWSRRVNEDVTIQTRNDKLFAVKQLALANDLYGNLKQTPTPPTPPPYYPPNYPQIPYDFRLTF